MTQIIFSRFLFLSFFLGESLAFGVRSKMGVVGGESSLAVSQEGQRCSQRLSLEKIKKQVGDAAKVTKAGLHERKPFSSLSIERNILVEVPSVEFRIVPEKKAVVLKGGSVPKLLDITIEKIFLSEIKLAGGWEELAEELTEFAERELNKQNLMETNSCNSLVAESPYP